MILIIDDDSAIRSSLSFMLKRAGYEVNSAASPDEAMEIVRSVEPQLILMDMNFSLSTSGEEGLTLLKQVKLFRADVPVILITAWGSIDLAVKGMQAGAFDFITKPWNNVVLMQRIETALELRSGKEDDNIEKTSDLFDRSNIIGKSEALMNVLSTVKRIAKTNASVLITGESGTGKELIAEAIHRNSRRSNMPFVKVNLGGISQSLFESEMFGHKKGAFTDAKADRKGRFEMADQGTIFLDVVGELDIRVTSATHANRTEMLSDHTFREALFYRINLITIHLPALRERREDIPLLVDFFAKKQCKANGFGEVQISADAMTYLSHLPFPGNIRELKNLVDRTILVNDKTNLCAEDFKMQYNGSCTNHNKTDISSQGLTLEEIEKATIISYMEKYHGNISQVAIALGLSRAALYRRLEKYNILLNE